MIGWLSGTLLEKHPPGLLVDVQGVGYELEAPMSTFYDLPVVGEPVQLHTHLVVREDAQLLYGFGTRHERFLFRTLLKVNGVGAKVALSILSGMNGEEFAACVARKDVAALTRIPGIGKKTAERLLVELQDKLEAGPGSLPGGAGVSSVASAVDHREQADIALQALGYKPAEAQRMLNEVAPGSVEEMIRAALRGMVRS